MQDPFCEVILSGQKKRTLASQDGGKRPKWTETFTFNFSGDRNLQVAAYDEDVTES